MKKKSTFLLIFLFSIHFTQAQFYKSILPSEAFSDSLAIIVQDFQKDFYTIEGAELNSQGEMEVYRSTVTIPGASHCIIYRYHSRQDTTSSWQGILYEGDSYEKAVKIYTSTYRLLKKSKMKWVDKSIITFTGDLQMPDENVRFAVSSLRLNIQDRHYRNFFGEIELTNTYDGWEVHLNLLKKKNDEGKY